MTPVAILVVTLTLTLTRQVTCFPFVHGALRADDGRALDAVATDLSDRLVKMTAQLQSQDALITELKTRLASVMQPAVLLTATFSKAQLRGLGDQQLLKFDEVMVNTGQGYSADTGLFTAPDTGLYIFNLNVARHPADPAVCVEVDLYRGLQQHVTTASSCALNDSQAARTASLRLARGDTVHVQVRAGDMLLGRLHTSLSAIKI